MSNEELRASADYKSLRYPITVVIPAYGRQDRLERALESLSYQTVQPDQVIVVDDFSPEKILIPDQYRLKLDVTLIRQTENKGASEARNQGVVQSRNKIVSFLDSDDIYDPSYIEAVWNAWQQSGPEVGLIATRFYWCDEHMRPYRCNSIIGEPITRSLLLRRGNVVGGVSVFSVRRDFLLSVGGFTITRGAQDWILLLKVLRAHEVVQLEQPLVYYLTPNFSPFSMSRNYRRQILGLSAVYREGKEDVDICAREYHAKLLAYLLGMAGRRRMALRVMPCNKFAVRTIASILLGARLINRIMRIKNRLQVFLRLAGLQVHKLK